MKCEVAQEKIALAVYGELPDEASPELERHLAECETCRRDHEAVLALQKAMYLYPVEEPSANLLARARMRLEESIDHLPARSWLLRITQNIFAGAGRLTAAPVAASALLVLGLGAGGLGGYEIATRLKPPTPSIAQAPPVSTVDESQHPIANVSKIVRQPNSETVDVTYNRLVPATMHGSLDDVAIRNLLLAGTLASDDNDIRSNSVKLLAAECRAGHKCSGGPIREALMIAARYDKSPAVRKEALAGLAPYIAEDVRVRDAVLEVIMKDDDPTVRTQAISVLRPVGADSSVRQVLHNVAVQDRNPYIRNASMQELSQLPEIQ
jgi:anti-sigma factor RsiW